MIDKINLDRLIRVANEEGLNGRKVRLIYIPPESATEIYGKIIIQDVTPKSATEA